MCWMGQGCGLCRPPRSGCEPLARRCWCPRGRCCASPAGEASHLAGRWSETAPALRTSPGAPARASPCRLLPDPLCATPVPLREPAGRRHHSPDRHRLARRQCPVVSPVGAQRRSRHCVGGRRPVPQLHNALTAIAGADDWVTLDDLAVAVGRTRVGAKAKVHQWPPTVPALQAWLPTLPGWSVRLVDGVW